ncbi:sirohydrochlorin chelatase [Alkalilimnicola ehrlichii MLHE-1]|uniref:Cobalamin (Vitamin B12) biosynthesis CbiX protein n=1 Tax=Alkalilimnicola ehrlichii (strain ATCC BAA-1101 / DSM 17681 / MLHE-1) TaxID=187272 RepID=Q0AB35_ALKEH|nr:CbiX/SirB N-terminal domain-containing protein [Alkalilimnicola ehrlichii]ABI55952.1 cobalamin (vitamin B12) biosynthesis CbiX protein [Alkalilimnicola ehrlichii MLHE-1]
MASEIFLVDNGSLRPQSILSLRHLAAALSERIGEPVQPVSLLHSDRAPEDALEGVPARTLEPTLRERAAAGTRHFRIVPLFFGPSRALTDYLPERVAALSQHFPKLDVQVAPPLVTPERGHDPRLAHILAESVQAVDHDPATRVILVDHGSPAPEVAQVRNYVAGQLSILLQGRVAGVVPASMERRPGEAHRFNEPLLETLLARPPFNHGRVVIAMMFLQPGRHAGPDGDVARICAEAEARHPALKTVMTPLVGAHPLLPEILADRLAVIHPPPAAPDATPPP